MLISISLNDTNLPYYSNCTQFSRRDTGKKGGLSDMISMGVDISFATLKKHVNKNDLQELIDNFGYDKSFKIEDDYAVRFKRSKLFGKNVYYIVHSSIEYIFGNL